MKKIILSLALVLSAWTTLNAQTSLGIKLGGNYSNLRGSDVLNPDAILAYHFGALIDFNLNDRLSLQPEVLYSVQGNTSNFKVFGNERSLDNSINYVQVPLLLKVYLTDGLSIDLGPQLGFNVKSASSFNNAVLNNDYAQDIDYGLVVGLGYETKNGFLFQGRYNAGLAEVIKGQDIRNSVASLSIGYLLLRSK